MKKLNIIGLIIFFSGLASLLGFSLYKFFEDKNVPIVVRWGTTGLIIGIIILLISLTLERLKEKKINI